MNFLRSWTSEKQSAFLYKILAKKEGGNQRGDLFQKLSFEAEKQAEIWAEKMRAAGEKVPSQYFPGPRVVIVGALVTLLGPGRIKNILATLKVRGMSVYSTSLLQGHATPKNVDEIGRRHRTVSTGGNLRAAVFGINDGLVSNASLILGIAGGVSGSGGDPKIILLSGIAGLLAGAFSMGAGEFISVKSQREMFEYQIGLEREELKLYPEEEAEELALIYEAKGLPRETAHALATKLISDPEKALDALAREELGLNPEDLGSPWGAAIASFLSFSFGALLPLLPFLFSTGSRALFVAIGVTACSLFAVGATLSLFTGKNAFWGGFRMLFVGGCAGAATYFVGTLLGVQLS